VWLMNLGSNAKSDGATAIVVAEDGKGNFTVFCGGFAEVVGANRIIPQPMCFPDIENDLSPKKVASRQEGEFHVGSVVRIISDLNRLRKLQDVKHGGWNQDMAQYVGQHGIIFDILDKWRLVVTFGEKLVVFNAKAVQVLRKSDFTRHKEKGKKHNILTGDLVMASDDVVTIEKIQNNHGGWRNSMKWIAGQIGIVAETFDEDDDNVHVCFGDYTYRLHTSILDTVDDTQKSKAESSPVERPKMQTSDFDLIIRNKKDYTNSEDKKNKVLRDLLKSVYENFGTGGSISPLLAHDTFQPSTYNPD